jgi:hypothetical protein
MNALPLLGALLAVLASADQSLTLSAPTVVTEWHGSQLKGEPIQLSWSPDGKNLYLQTLEGASPGARHSYLVSLETRTSTGLDGVPSWAATYWEWKSARMAPGHPELVIQVDTTTKGGKVPSQSLRDKSKGNLVENAVAAQNEADAVIRTLTLKGEAIGQYVNQPLVPGTTFGWSPETLHAVAYAKTDGHLAVLDFDMGRIDVEGTKGVLLPAWSPDGTAVVYLQKTGRRDYVLSMVSVKQP